MVANVKPHLYWLIATGLLTVLISGAAFVTCLRWEPEQPIEILLPAAPNHTGTIFLDGAVANPGLYPFTAGDTIESLIQAAGGLVAGANLSSVKLTFVPDGVFGPQKININRAEPWLLEALPGIGPTIARRIVDYRQDNGPFRATSDLLKINGLGTNTFQKIEGFITVGD